jgi:glyoxylase-like metal-dependent hydrolase (beta-lactamase superfamily II)
MPRTQQRLYSPPEFAESDYPQMCVGWRAGKMLNFHSNELPFGELVLTGSNENRPHVLDWQSVHAVPLLKNVKRLTAPNAGFMTGPGTNVYLVGDKDSGFIVIDPGPSDETHLQRILDVVSSADSTITAIVCTHSHQDHSTGAKPLQDLCTASGLSTPPILGVSSASTAKPEHNFKPDRELLNGERLTLAGADGTTHTLRVIYAPGHAANHICLVLEEDGLLFSGDQVLSGSTTVIDPPDGNMNLYLESLDNLAQACVQGHIKFILPAHGHVLGDPCGAIARLIEHRLEREALVLDAVRADPKGNLDTWVASAYGDVSKRAWGAAKRSLFAHLERLRHLGAI